METLVKSSPEVQGVDSAGISAFLDDVNENVNYLHSLILLRHGQVVAEGYWSPYEAAEPHIMFSLSKSFTSTAVGFAVAEGRLKITDPVIAFFPDDLPPEINDNMAAMQVQHLLSMSTGHADDTMLALHTAGDKTWVQAFLGCPVVYAPGTHFLYNTGATYMLSAIVQKLTGQTLLEYLQPRLFGPLGIENPAWENSPEGINTGGFGLSITTRDIARFGQFYLQKGAWEGRQLLPQSWVEEAAASHISNGDDPASDWQQGYGYQFWRCRHGAYRGDGAFGQYCVVMPGQDAVLAITSGLMDMQEVLNLVWKYLLPAMKDKPLPPNPAASAELAEKLKRLAIAPVNLPATGSAAAGVSGQKFAVAENEAGISSVKLDFAPGGGILTVVAGEEQSQVTFGCGEWQKGTTDLFHPGPRKYAASAGWLDDRTLVIQVFYLTPILAEVPDRRTGLIPFGLTLTFRFVEESVTINIDPNVSFMSEWKPQLQGKLA